MSKLIFTIVLLFSTSSFFLDTIVFCYEGDDNIRFEIQAVKIPIEKKDGNLYENVNCELRCDCSESGRPATPGIINYDNETDKAVLSAKSDTNLHCELSSKCWPEKK